MARLFIGIREPEHLQSGARANPISRANLSRLGGAYWWVVALGAVISLARFSETIVY